MGRTYSKSDRAAHCGDPPRGAERGIRLIKYLKDR
jgi:hypothetical protein